MKTIRSPSTANSNYTKKNFRSGKSNSSSSSSSSSRNGSNSKLAAGVAFNFNDQKLVQSMNDRLNFLLIKALGSKVIATVISGDRYKGTVVAIDNTDLSVVLSNVTAYQNIFNDASSSISEKEESLPKELIIESKNIMDLQFLNIDLTDKIVPVVTTEGANASNKAMESAFKTDTAISGNQKIRERELHMWAPSEEDSKLLDSTALLLDDIDNNTMGSSRKNIGLESWDQFEVNEKVFGVKSSYDENLYTTRINKDAPDYQERLKEADRIAKEIESSGYNGNVHLAEERGLAIDDSGLDEEDKYSGVDRRGDDLMAFLKSGNGAKGATSSNLKKSASSKPDTSSASLSVNNGKYIPPKQRNEVQHMDPAILSSVKGVKPVPGTKKNNKVIIKDVNAQQAIASLKEFSQNFKIPEFKNISKSSTSKGFAIFGVDTIPSKTPVKESDKQSIKEPSTEASKVPASGDNSKKSESLTFKESSLTASSSATTKSNVSAAKEDDSKKSKPVSKPASPSKKKMDPRAPAFKLNPAARAFTPSTSLPPPHSQHLQHPLPPLVPQMVLPTGGAPLPIPSIIPSGGAGSPLKSFSSIHNSNSSATGGSVSPASAASPGLRHQTMSRHGHGKIRVSIPPFLKQRDDSAKAKGDLNHTDFNFIYTASKQEGPIEKAYFTQPLWSSNSEASYKDDFPEDLPMVSSMHNMHVNGMPPLMNGLGGGSGMMIGNAASGMPPPIQSFIPSNPAAALAAMNPNMLSPMNMLSPRSAMPMMLQQQVSAASTFDAASGQMFVPGAMNPAAAALASSSAMNVDPNLYMQFATQFMMNAASLNGNGAVGGMTSPMMGGFPMMGMQQLLLQGQNYNANNSHHHNNHHNSNNHHNPYSGNRGIPMGSPQIDAGYNNGNRGSYSENRYYGGNNRGRHYHNNHNNHSHHHHSGNNGNNSSNTSNSNTSSNNH